MEVDFTRIQGLVSRPSESLSVEIKSWINPNDPHGQSKIVRAALALRNFGGGDLIIGLNDSTLLPDLLPAYVSNVRDLYHHDKIQALVSRFASEVFEVAVSFVEKEGIEVVVVSVGGGVRVPVAAKAELILDGKKVVAIDDVYVRTLTSNNRPSTAKVGWKDWPMVMEVCFDNREADIGRFLRRHLPGAEAGSLFKADTAPSTREALDNLLANGEYRMVTLAAEHKVPTPRHGTWEVAMVIDGQVPSHRTNKPFLHLLEGSNPSLSGWPVWLVSEGFADSDSRPFVYNGGWEALVKFSGGAQFMRYEPAGRFVQRSPLEDDNHHSEQGGAVPGGTLEFVFPILNCAEAIATGQAFAVAMGCPSESTTLHFAFRWSGLKGRVLSSWAHRSRILPGYKAHQGEITTYCSVPLNISTSAIPDACVNVLEPLYELFDGTPISHKVIVDCATRFLDRKPVT